MPQDVQQSLFSLMGGPAGQGAPAPAPAPEEVPLDAYGDVGAQDGAPMDAWAPAD